MGNRPVDAGHDVLEVAAAPVGAVHLDEPLPVSGRSADVRIEDGVPARHEKLTPRLERVRPSSRRSAMNKDDERQPRVFCPRGWFQERRFDLHVVAVLVLDELGRRGRD